MATDYVTGRVEASEDLLDRLIAYIEGAERGYCGERHSGDDWPDCADRGHIRANALLAELRAIRAADGYCPWCGEIWWSGPVSGPDVQARRSAPGDAAQPFGTGPADTGDSLAVLAAAHQRVSRARVEYDDASRARAALMRELNDSGVTCETMGRRLGMTRAAVAALIRRAGGGRPRPRKARQYRARGVVEWDDSPITLD